METQNKLYLYLAILIPFLMIIITSLGVIYYKVDLRPNYHFIYMVKNSDSAYQCSQQIKADIFQSPSATQTKSSVDCSSAKLYEYNFANKQSKLISLDQVKKMKLTKPTQKLSPDGFAINTNCNSSDISGWSLYSESNYSICIQHGDLKQKLNINHSKEYPDDFYYFFFIGWVIHESASIP